MPVLREVETFLHALRFMTTLPLPPTRAYHPDWLPRAAKHFPLVGILVGSLAAAVFVLASRVWSGALVPALLAVAASVLLTGALHEDGLADTADALGGGRTVEGRLAIMKDSRIGVFGALALVLSVALRAAALAALPPVDAAAALVGAHAGGRFATVAILAAFPYAGERAQGRISYPQTTPHPWELGWAAAATAWAVLPLVFVSGAGALAAIAGGVVLAAILAFEARRLIEGYTGDVLGAAEQLFEVGFLLGAAAAVHA